MQSLQLVCILVHGSVAAPGGSEAALWVGGALGLRWGALGLHIRLVFGSAPGSKVQMCLGASLMYL